MRKNTVRHWLHAGLDLLPLILIPVFMIYSHRHTIDSGSIEVPQNQVVDFNQLIPNDYINFDSNDMPSTWYGFTTFQFEQNDKLYFKSEPSIENNAIFAFYFPLDESNITAFEGITTLSKPSGYCSFAYRSGEYVGTINLYNLTKMFGAGNEPTIAQFDSWYSNYSYDYTLSRKELLKGVSTITFDDTDIMSQFTYQLYNSVDKYFNMGNVFGMSNVYDWFNLNIFGGNAPISIYIVWNIVLYEFVMDLLFLLYALFMWFIDMTKRLIEKPLNSIK